MLSLFSEDWPFLGENNSSWPQYESEDKNKYATGALNKFPLSSSQGRKTNNKRVRIDYYYYINQHSN